ncbi:cold shock domain-containing protein [Clostridium sp. HBUAS56010]|uniref:cold-shock protein n=1 Tax=Clostridium sp. HBUAS56010 TaxID=2571127 RepID=UPI0011783208|nr:cold shock domain-containing protein [Clostridium sp. HBUAS56010]
MFGTVTKYFEDKGFGFIRGENGQSYFIHWSKLNGEHVERGYLVNFDVYSTDRSDYNAMNISVIEAAERKYKNGKKNK